MSEDFFLTPDRMKRMRQLRMQGVSERRALAGPQTVHIDLTNSCNTNCTTCWDHSPLLTSPRSVEWKRKFLRLDDFLPLADDLAAMESVESVILSGMGDPFINPNIYQIIDVCKKRGWYVTTLTNALLADPKLIIRLNVDMMLISINGVTEKSYTAFHPNLTARDFNALRQKLDVLADAGKRFKHVQVINRDTADELIEMTHFAARYNAKSVTFKLASLGHGTETCAILESQRVALLERLIPLAKLEANALGVETNLDVFERQLLVGGLATASLTDIGCFMGWWYARVTVEGKILFCCSTEIEVGDLAHGTFSEQWRGEAWQAIRERLMRGDYFPSCSQCGKLNQNVKIGRIVARALGEETRLARIGRGLQKASAP